MYSRKMVQSSKQRVLKVTWERCCDLAWKASRRSLHRDHTSVLARDVQGAKATPNRGRGRQGAQARKNWPPRLHENSQCFVTCHKKLKMSGCISEKKSGCISEKKSGCISDPHAPRVRQSVVLYSLLLNLCLRFYFEPCLRAHSMSNRAHVHMLSRLKR